jgi:hypothetical protein
LCGSGFSGASDSDELSIKKQKIGGQILWPKPMSSSLHHNNNNKHASVQLTHKFHEICDWQINSMEICVQGEELHSGITQFFKVHEDFVSGKIGKDFDKL